MFENGSNIYHDCALCGLPIINDIPAFQGEYIEEEDVYLHYTCPIAFDDDDDGGQEPNLHHHHNESNETPNQEVVIVEKSPKALRTVMEFFQMSEDELEELKQRLLKKHMQMNADYSKKLKALQRRIKQAHIERQREERLAMIRAFEGFKESSNQQDMQPDF